MTPRILVTGAGGYLGSQLVAALAQREGHVEPVHEQRAVDRMLDAAHHQARAQMDVRAPELRALFVERRPEVVVHLASIVTPGPGSDRAFEYSVDVDGTRRVLDACLAAGVKRLVVSSSGAAYGYHADNPPRLSEDMALRGNDEFAYARHKRLVEEMLARARAELAALEQVVFRIGTILGERVHNQITALFERARPLVIRGSASPFVFVWDDMQRFRVKESSLPPGSTIVGRPDSFWYRHATVLIVSGAIIALLVVFLAILLALLARARKAEQGLKESEASLQASLGEKEILIREIHHRVKNNLQIVASILSLGKGRGSGSEADDALVAARLRIETMAYVHEELYESEDRSRVDFMALVDRIVCRLRDSLCPPGVEMRYPSLGHLPLDIDRAFPCGLIIEELVSNALGHAFAGRASGLVELSIAEEAGQLRLTVTDDGIGHPAGFDPERSSSVGYSIVYALASQLGADFSLVSGPGGSTARLVLPLAP